MFIWLGWLSRVGCVNVEGNEWFGVWCGENGTSIWTPKWNFTPPVPFPHLYMHVRAGHSLREMKSNLMPMTYAATARSYGSYYGPTYYKWTVSLRNCTSGTPSTGKRKPGLPENEDLAYRRLHWRAIIQRDISKMELDWTVEETEVALREQIMWRYLSN